MMSMPLAAVLLLALVPSGPPQTPSPQRLERAHARAVEESRIAGDPRRPAAREMTSREAYLAFVGRVLSAEGAEARGQARPYAFISPVAPMSLRARGCSIVGETPAGVMRADGLYNGYRTLALCGQSVVDVMEFDYRQPLTQRVTIHLPQEAVNAAFGPGRSTARYYVSANGERTTAFHWHDEGQEVTLHAVGPTPQPDVEIAGLQQLMTVIVEGRLSDRP